MWQIQWFFLEMDEEEKQKMKEIKECLLSIEETVRRLEQ